MLRSLPNVENAHLILSWVRQGKGVDEATVLYRRKNNGCHKGDPVVQRIYADPLRYDTYIDMVAVERAFRGDREVWEALTHYERQAVRRLVVDTVLSNKKHPRWPEHGPYLQTAEESLAKGCSVQGWLALLDESLGLTGNYFSKHIRRKGRRR